MVIGWCLYFFFCGVGINTGGVGRIRLLNVGRGEGGIPQALRKKVAGGASPLPLVLEKREAQCPEISPREESFTLPRRGRLLQGATRISLIRLCPPISAASVRPLKMSWKLASTAAFCLLNLGSLARSSYLGETSFPKVRAPHPKGGLFFLAACGQNAVLDGSEAGDGGGGDLLENWPWMVSVGRRDEAGGGWVHKCSGALVTDRHVVTAGHCALDLGWRLRFGHRDLDSKDAAAGAAFEREILRAFVHPK